VSASRRLLDAVASTVEPPPPVAAWADALLGERPTPRRGSGLTLDGSLSLRGDGRDVARFSVNDRGAPAGFRARLRELAAGWGFPSPALLDAFFAVAPPGRVQTTVGVKAAGAAPDRVSLYFEELTMAPDRGRAIADATAGLTGLPGGDDPPMAVALDVSRAGVVAFKRYVAAVDLPDRPGAPPLPGSLEAYRRRLPFRRGERRLLIATRTDPGGVLRGRKLLWVPEVRQSGDVRAVWGTVGSLRRALRLPLTRSSRALDLLAADGAMYPDLVSLDADGDGVPEGLTVYVAVRPT